MAVIVAAGKGKRMRPFTYSLPKPMLEVGGAPILKRSLKTLASVGIRQVVIVTGYGRKRVEALRYPPLKLIYQFNPFFGETNDLMSLWFARTYLLQKDFLYLHGDLLYHSNVLRRCIDAPKTTILYDSSGSGMDREAMKVQVRNGRYVQSSKKLSSRLSSGEFVGICKFSVATGRRLMWEAERLFDESERMAYDTRALNNIAGDIAIHAVDVAGLPWIEIDSPSDFERAERVVLPLIEKAR